MEPSAFLSKTLRGKYCPNTSIWGVAPRPTDSLTWKFLLKATKVVKKHIKWIIGNGEKIAFWDDCWCGQSTIRRLLIGPLDRG